MPTFGAMLVASLAGWLVASPLDAWLGGFSGLAVSFVVSTFAFYYARRVLSGLRDGS